MSRHWLSHPALVGVFLLLLSCSDDITQPAVEGPLQQVNGSLREPLEVQALTLDERLEWVANNRIPGFAGLWVDSAGPIVYLTDLSQQSVAESWIAEQAQPLPRRPLRIRLAHYNWTSLVEWRKRFLSLPAIEGLYWIDVDDQGNRIRVGVRDETVSQLIKLRAMAIALPAGALSVEIENGPPQLNTDLTFRKRPVEGGYAIEDAYGGICTYGFSAYLKNGTKVFWSASHCSQNPFSQPDNGIMYQPLAAPGYEIAREIIDRTYYQCDAGQAGSCRYSDAAAFEYYNPQVLHRTGFIGRPINWGVISPGSIEINAGDPVFEITATEERGIYLDNHVDKVGRMSGWTRGTRTEGCIDVYPYGALNRLHCVDVGNFYSEGGDSGSPVFLVTNGVAYPARVMLRGVYHGTKNQSNTQSVYSTMTGIWNDFFSPDLSNYIYACSGFAGSCGGNPAYGAPGVPQPVEVYISGPSYVMPYSYSCVWFAMPSGGTPPYTYDWGGIFEGYTSSSVNTNVPSSGWATVDVYSSDGQHGYAELYVQSSWEAPGCEG